MTAIYRGILEKIADRPEAVLHGRVRLSRWAKLMICWRAMRRRCRATTLRLCHVSRRLQRVALPEPSDYAICMMPIAMRAR
jgi:hypothetical protein